MEGRCLTGAERETTEGTEPFTAPARATRQPRSFTSSSSCCVFHLPYLLFPLILILEDTVRHKKGLPHMMKKREKTSLFEHF